MPANPIVVVAENQSSTLDVKPWLLTLCLIITATILQIEVHTTSNERNFLCVYCFKKRIDCSRASPFLYIKKKKKVGASGAIWMTAFTQIYALIQYRVSPPCTFLSFSTALSTAMPDAYKTQLLLCICSLNRGCHFVCLFFFCVPKCLPLNNNGRAWESQDNESLILCVCASFLGCYHFRCTFLNHFILKIRSLKKM